MAMAKRNFGWSQSGTLITFNPNRAVTLQKEFPTSGNYTIQFGINQKNAVNIRPEALISWNVKGNQVSRRVTVGKGTSISGQAESVTVKMYDALIAGMSGTPGEVYEASIQVTKGIRASAGQQAPIYIPTEGENPLGTAVVINNALVVADTTSASFPIPEGATQVIGAILSGPVAVALDASDVIMSAQNPSGQIATWYPIPPAWMPLPPMATEVVVSNRSGQNLNVMVLFGIDG